MTRINWIKATATGGSSLNGIAKDMNADAEKQAKLDTVHKRAEKRVGFLDEKHTNEFHNDGSTIYTKTALWRKSLRLDTDSQLKLRVVN